MWFLPREAGARPTHATETPEMDDGLPREAGDVTRRTDGETDANADADRVALPTDVPDGVDDDAARDAIDAAREYLRTDGPASKREIVAAVMPEHSLGYDVPELEPGDRYRGNWWDRVVRPGLDRLDDVTYRENYSEYAYTGDDA